MLTQPRRLIRDTTETHNDKLLFSPWLLLLLFQTQGSVVRSVVRQIIVDQQRDAVAMP